MKLKDWPKFIESLNLMYQDLEVDRISIDQGFEGDNFKEQLVIRGHKGSNPYMALVLTKDGLDHTTQEHIDNYNKALNGNYENLNV